MRLAQALPDPGLLESEHVDVPAPPARAYEAVRAANLGASPFARALFSIRTLPDRIRGKASSEELVLTLGDFERTGPGFHVLHDEPGVAFTVGAIGRFWRPSIPFLDVPSTEFAAFREPGYGKVAWELRFEPNVRGGTRVVFELRVATTDRASWRKFRWYFRVIGPFSRWIRRDVMRRIGRELGAASG